MHTQVCLPEKAPLFLLCLVERDEHKEQGSPLNCRQYEGEVDGKEDPGKDVRKPG